MSFTVVDAEQRSASWFSARLGRVTGSRAKDVVASIKNGEAAARRDYRTQLVCERLTGQVQEDGYVSPEMQRGTDLEPDAFAAYEAVTGQLVRRTGFLAHNSLMVGCSLDGDVGDFAGIVELKCPKSATHLGYLKSGGVLPANHRPQVLHNLWVSGAQWCDFASYDPRYPEHLQLFIVHVERLELEIVAYSRAVEAFLAEVDAEYQSVVTLDADAA